VIGDALAVEAVEIVRGDHDLRVPRQALARPVSKFISGPDAALPSPLAPPLKASSVGPFKACSRNGSWGDWHWRRAWP
jgi:hypothetical protein